MNDANPKLHRACRFGAAFVSLAAATTVAAGTFTISPVRVELDAGRNTEVLTVRNEEDAPLLIHAKAVAWFQEKGEEHYVDTRDLLLTPPVFQLAPKAEQIVRVALRHRTTADRELQYRLILTEVPQASADRFVGLNVALSMSIPVFIKATATGPQLTWTSRLLPDGSLRVTARNSGNAHIQVFDFDVQSDTQVVSHAALSRYVLPGSEIGWTLTLRKDFKSGGELLIRGNSDQGEFRATAAREGS